MSPADREIPGAPGISGDLGVLDPGVMAAVVHLRRYDPGPRLAGLVAWFWAVRWRIPPGRLHEQRIVAVPGANLSLGHGQALGPDRPGPIEARLVGPQRRVSCRRLTGEGWTVAALTTVGGLGAFCDTPVTGFTDRELPLAELGGAVAELGGAADDLLAAVAAEAGEADAVEASRVDRLRDWLECAVAAADPSRVAIAREVARIADLAATEPDTRLEELAAAAGVTPRALQRMFADHAGVTPTWVVRRWRLIRAVAAAGGAERPDWASLASELGYSDQAHLVRDFRRHVGEPPGRYRARQPAGSSPADELPA